MPRRTCSTAFRSHGSPLSATVSYGPRWSTRPARSGLTRACVLRLPGTLGPPAGSVDVFVCRLGMRRLGSAWPRPWPVARRNHDRCGGTPEVVRDGETGRSSADPTIPGDLAERIVRLLGDPELRRPDVGGVARAPPPLLHPRPDARRDGCGVRSGERGRGARANLNGLRVTSPAPRDPWEAALARDPNALVSHTPAWIDCLCAFRGYEDASRLYELPGGRSLVLPMVRPGICRGRLPARRRFPPAGNRGNRRSRGRQARGSRRRLRRPTTAVRPCGRRCDRAHWTPRPGQPPGRPGWWFPAWHMSSS